MIETSFSSYSAGQFLLFYFLLFGFAVLSSLFIAGRLRPQGRHGDLDEALELAYLAGGTRRVTEATLAGLLSRGAIKLTSKRKLYVVERGEGVNGPERSILALTGEFGLKSAFSAVEPHADAIEDRLAARGAMMNAGERSSLKFYAAAPFLLLLAVGAWRLFAGIAQEEPVGLLLLLMALVLIAMIVRLATISPLTVEGDEALERRRGVEDRLRIAPRGGEMTTAVALFGTVVLVGTPIESLNAMRTAAAADGSGGYAFDGGGSDSGSGGSDGGGGGCGGGGCGGCGG